MALAFAKMPRAQDNTVHWMLVRATIIKWQKLFTCPYKHVWQMSYEFEIKKALDL